MILYFDSYITDVPLKGRGRELLKEDIRKKCKTYAMPKRLDIVKYVLASYALLPWSFVLIRYELEDPRLYRETDIYIRSLFPKATIIHKRSATQKVYQESLQILERLRDSWIFYSPNNDHPLLSPDPHVGRYLQTLIRLAEKWQKKYAYASIMYSHFSEFLNIGKPGNPEHFLHGRNTKMLEDTSLARVYLMPKGDFASVQIVHKNLFRHWFSSGDLGDKRVIRAEDVMEKVLVKNHVIIAPKKIVCAHFDGYEHMLGRPNEIQSDKIPPLFIPQGFFSNNIYIAYGYKQYRPGWVNINPCSKTYSFRDSRYGTDMKIGIDDIPLFWQNHIKEIDINQKITKQKLLQCIRKQKDILIAPWSLRNQELSLKTGIYWVKFLWFFCYIQLRIFGSQVVLRRFSQK